MRRPTPGQVLLGVAGLAALAVVVWRAAVALRSDETRVKLVLEDVARQARERDYLGVLKYLDPEYRDDSGLTYAEVKPLVVRYLMRAESVEAEVEPVSPVTVEGDRATVRVRATVVASLPEGTLTLGAVYRLGGSPAGLDLYDLDLKRHKSYFRCTRVRPARALEQEAAP